MHFLSKRSLILSYEVPDVHDNLLLKEKSDVSEASDIFLLSNINSPSELKKEKAVASYLPLSRYGS
jgi:hypothetical protein